MKTSLLFLFVLSLLLFLPNKNKAEQMQDSLNPCWKLVIPNEPDKGYFNPDSVMYDSCLCKNKPWEKHTCEYMYAKQWFTILLPYNALLLPKVPRDSIMIRTWQDIDTFYTEIRDSLRKLENIFGGFILRKPIPDDIDSMSLGSRTFDIRFNNYVKIDTVANYLSKINEIEASGYNWRAEFFDNIYDDNEIFQFKLSPNPASDYLYISLPSELPQGKIEIFSIEGINIFETEAVNRIDVSSLSPGVYFVKFGSKVAKFLKM